MLATVKTALSLHQRHLTTTGQRPLEPADVAVVMSQRKASVIDAGLNTGLNRPCGDGRISSRLLSVGDLILHFRRVGASCLLAGGR